MNLKEFLKPDRRKIVMFVMFFIIIFLYLTTGPIGYCPSCMCSNYYFLPWEWCKCYCGEPDLLTTILIEIYYPLLFVVSLIVSYLLSCIMIWIYDNSKKVKKK